MIDFQNICKSYAGKQLFKDCTFRINPGERIGIVGPNGSGKSTLFAMICDEISPDRGSLSIPANLRIGYLRQQLAIETLEENLLDYVADCIPELKILQNQIKDLEKKLENITEKPEREKILNKIGHRQLRYENLGGYSVKTFAGKALGGLGFHEKDFYEPLSNLSGGWQMRAALARILISNSDILLLDEPSNYLDLPAIEWLEHFLKDFKGTLMLISHDRFLLKSLTSTVIEVNGGLITRYPGNFDFYLKERENRYHQKVAAKSNQDRKKEQMERFINRFRAKNTKATLVKSQIKKLEKMEEVELPDQLHYSGTITIPKPPHSGHEIVRLENAAFSYDKENWILQNIDFSVEKGEKIGIVGFNGTGKTTFLKLLTGKLNLNEGKRIVGHKVVQGYQAQEFSEILSPEQSVYDVVKAVVPDGSEYSAKIRNILGSFGFSGDDIDKQIKVLSGGEKIRLSFARIFVHPPNFLVLDEPTTHLDLAAREALQQAIQHYEGAVCLVSHDLEFVRGTAKKIVAMTPPGIKIYYGDYDYYREKATILNPEKSVERKAEINPGNLRSKRREKAAQRSEFLADLRKLKNRISQAENNIDNLENNKQELIDQLALNWPGTDFEAINRKLKEIEDKINENTVAWEKNASALEKLNEVYKKI